MVQTHIIVIFLKEYAVFDPEGQTGVYLLDLSYNLYSCNHIYKFNNMYNLLAYLSALFPAGGMMIGIGYLDSTELSIVLVCLGLYGLTATYRSGSITNQVEIGPK